MKLLMIMPDAKMHKFKLFGHIRSSREAPLTLTTLAALVPPEWDIVLVDGSIDQIPWYMRPDLVAISVMTGTSMRAYEIADHFRAHKIPVILGGVHVTILPEEARIHADCLIIGFGEKSWPQALADFSNGQLQAEYKDLRLDSDSILEGVPLPRMDLQRRSGYMIPDTVQATRGCRHACDFCSVASAWPNFIKRPIADVIRDIANLPGKRIALNDVSLVDDVEYAKELFKAMIPLKKIWGGLATAMIVDDLELVQLAAQSGCQYLLIGFESNSSNTLKQIHKGFNAARSYEVVMRILHAYGISVQGCFVFGFDHDDKNIFKQTIDLVQSLKIDIPRYSIYTPYPGTELYRRLDEDGRILTKNWDNYDTMHVVHRPKLMTPEELYEGFKWSYKETFRLGNITKRTIWPIKNSSLINFFGNLTYKIFVHKLYNWERYHLPYMPTYLKGID